MREILSLYVEHVLDSMDINCLIAYVRDDLTARYDDLSENDFLAMVEEYAPHLIDAE